MHTNLPPGLNDVVAVAAGGINGSHEFSLALKSDGHNSGNRVRGICCGHDGCGPGRPFLSSEAIALLIPYHSITTVGQ